MRALAIIVFLAGHAQADSPKLADAKQALDEVRYDDARRLLVEALDAGGNSPGAVRQIYELSASTAIVLGQRELGEQYYRRWLAIEPTAKLAQGSPPKLVDVFVAAQAYMAAHGRLAVKAERRAPTEVEVIVETDPLAMAASVALDKTPVPLASDRRARLPVPAEATRVFVLDDRGNQLLGVDVLAAANVSPTDAPAPPVFGIPRYDEPPRPVMKRWKTWGVPAGAFLVAGGIFGIVAITQHGEVEDAIERSGDFFFEDVESKRKSARRNATIGIALGAAGALLAIPAAIFYSQTRRPWNIGRLSLTVHPTGVAGSF